VREPPHAGSAASLLAESAAPDSGPPRLALTAWRDRFDLAAGITTRGPAGAYSLGRWDGAAPTGAAFARWDELRGAAGPGFAAVVIGHQVHGAAVRWQAEGFEGWLTADGYDGHATGATGVLLAVSVADCVPVYLADRRGRAHGLLHAGWRGTAAGVLEAAVGELSTRAAVSTSDIVMHCGVAICGSCYEVGPEVIINVTGRAVSGPELLDLRAELAGRAARLGVGEVTTSPHCTAHHADLFHSHRASRGRAGRMIAYLGRPGRA